MTNALILPEPSTPRANRAAWRALCDEGEDTAALRELNELRAIAGAPAVSKANAAAGDVPAPRLLAAFRAAMLHELRLRGLSWQGRADEFSARNEAVNVRFRRYAKR